jgi:hypothetical protein
MKNLITTIALILIAQLSLQSQAITQSFFDEVHSFMSTEVTNGTLDYASLQSNSTLKSLMKQIKGANLDQADDATKKAFYINAYNLHVINQAVSNYPLSSVQEVKGFFDGKKITVAGRNRTLNDLEKKELLKPYNDGRLHFVLVCGALGCPPITNFAYRPEQLDAQLDKQTRLALNDKNFIQTSPGKIGLSQIFKWYPTDFGKNLDGVLDFINKYRNTPLSKSDKVSYYNYDWSLNDISNATTSVNGTIIPSSALGNNSARYIVSSTIPEGSVELKIFNNLYTQRTGYDGENFSDRGNFFTTTLSALYGLHSKFNVGINTRFRRVSNDVGSSSAFKVLGNGEAFSRRQGVTAFGPQIRYAPVDAWENFSIQSSFVFAIGDELEGNGVDPFIDWNGATWHTQFFNDFPIGNNFSLFTEIDLLIEDIGNSDEGFSNRISTPVIAIFSYNPNLKTTLYAISGFSPFWQSDFDYFYQYGAGAKYQFTPDVEIELLVTDFTNKFLDDTGGNAATFNLGFRFNL